MPVFVNNGPDIPERLLQAHEEGRVVFFCGAGISYPAGLPGFSGLVHKLFEELGITPTRIQKSAIKESKFDTVINQLEKDHAGGRTKVRETIAKILTPDFNNPNSTDTHESLLTLARNREGQFRLVTTNFDRIFETVITNKNMATERFKAPQLPIPNNRWNGLVYLHGLLPAAEDAAELDKIVVSSGDFGLAYLNDRWASRFVSELFRKYTVCFVGYSINDPILRYMMDALAANRLLGESHLEMFAFSSFSKNKEKETAEELKDKNVTPILYRNHKNHIYLHKTMKKWADTYRDGMHGKQMIIAQHAPYPPLTSSKDDFAVGRVLWALKDEMAAKHFAELDPVPPLEWLKPLSNVQYGYNDLVLFGIVPDRDINKNLSFSFLSRPTPYTKAGWMNFVNMGLQHCGWDKVMDHLAFWLTRHLNDPELILWIVKQGGYLHTQFANHIQDQIRNIERLERKGDEEEINRIKEAAPNAIPGPMMRTLWKVILSGRLKSKNPDIYFDLDNWIKRFKVDGTILSLRMELREALEPRIILRNSFREYNQEINQKGPKAIKDIVDWEIVLSNDDIHNDILVSKDNIDFQAALPNLLQDFTLLLRDALDLMRELGGADDHRDMSCYAQPSISNHLQNHHINEWTVLIDLIRDAWLSIEKTNPFQARHIVLDWWQTPYPLFKRLAFFAAANSNAITPHEALDWLFAYDHWWLWSTETERELIRLLVALVPKLDQEQLLELEQLILQGPPRKMFNDDIEAERYKLIVDRKIWLRLMKIKATKVTLNLDTEQRLEELRKQYPLWELADDERDEFSSWVNINADSSELVQIPLHRKDLIEWLKQDNSDHWQRDDWFQRCRDDFSTTACALWGLQQEGLWFYNRWHEALNAWTEDKLRKRSWRYMAQVIIKAPDEILHLLSSSLSWWLESISGSFKGHEDIFFNLIQKIINFESIKEDNKDGKSDLVTQAINHPIGHATKALLYWWYNQEPMNSQGINSEVKPFFTKLCDTNIDMFRHGRLLLAVHVIALFRADEEWTKTYLLPLFDWQQSESEAQGAWEGFLRSPHIYPPLLKAIKQPFLETVKHYKQLGVQTKQYVEFLTFITLDPGDVFTIKELAEATQNLPLEGLQTAIHTVYVAFKNAGEQRGEFWRNRILPYYKSIWPKSKDKKSSSISFCFGQICITAQETFNEAIKEFKPWFQPLQHCNHLFSLLHEAKLCQKFPCEALEFLDAVIDTNAFRFSKELKHCLNDIGNTNPGLRKDQRFVRISELCERRGIS